MSPSPFRWTRIPAPSLPRSSHSLSIINGKVYIYGGEITPREPVDNAVHVVDIATGKYEVVDGKGDVPEARVGHTASVVNGEVLVFGGRGGAAMTPLDEGGAVHAYNPTTSAWRRLSSTSAKYPCARSYHASTTSKNHLIIHAGCGDKSTGRLRDTWSFDPSTRAWTEVGDAPGDPRGGAALCSKDGKIWRFGGFNGKTEMGGEIDRLPFPSGKWSSLSFSTTKQSGSGPEPRSVAALQPLGNHLVAIFGEGKPSPTGGHDAAGNFWEDVWAFDPASEEWSEVSGLGEGPEPRGWFGSDAEEGKVVIWGGINGANKRLEDGWVLSAA